MFINININSDFTPCVEECRAMIPGIQEIIGRHCAYNSLIKFQSWGDLNSFSDNPYNQGYFFSVGQIDDKTAEVLAGEVLPYIKHKLRFVSSARPTLEVCVPGNTKVYEL